MKNIFLTILVAFLSFSCVNDPEVKYGYGEKIHYKIISFYSVNDISVDLNKDGIKNSDIMQEVDYYFDNYSVYDDLEEIRSMEKTKKGKITETGNRFFYFKLPVQYFPPYEEMPPTRAYSFERSTYKIRLDMDKNNISQSIYIDDENSVLQFEKTSETSYEAIIEKKYYDFATSSYTKHKYKVIFEKM